MVVLKPRVFQAEGLSGLELLNLLHSMHINRHRCVVHHESELPLMECEAGSSSSQALRHACRDSYNTHMPRPPYYVRWGPGQVGVAAVPQWVSCSEPDKCWVGNTSRLARAKSVSQHPDSNQMQARGTQTTCRHHSGTLDAPMEDL